MMILRVYAMWNQSRKILCLLLLVYVMQIVLSIITAVVYNPNTYMLGTSQDKSAVSMQSQ